LLKGKATLRETDGNRNPTVTAEGNEPENAGPRETRRRPEARRAKGKNPAGKRETGGKPTENPEDVS